MDHFVSGRSMAPPYPDGYERAMFAMGCFWGVERKFWQLDGVWVTASGYAGGDTENPTYREVCSGTTGHAETVLIVYDPAQISYTNLLKVFFESHDPTQGMRQGGDIGSQYRSVIFWFDESQRLAAEAGRDAYGRALAEAGHKAPITTEIVPAAPFYPAEEYHQQYLAKNPGGYCGVGGTGVTCTV